MGSMQRLEMRQGQALVMTPQLLQAIKLLQLSHLELAAYLDAEYERNPLLVEREASPGPEPEGDLPPAFEDGTAHEPELAAPDSDLLPYLGNLTPPPSQGDHGRSAGSDNAYGISMARPVTLAEHLERQLDLTQAPLHQRAIAIHLAHSLDEAGYLTEDVDDVARLLGVAVCEVESALRLLQSLDPPGIGARSLAECLSLQLADRDRLDPAMQALLTRLDLVARRDLPALKRLCRVDEDDVLGMLAEVRCLQPKPGLAFETARPFYLMPDVLVREAADGSFAIELNPDTVPSVLVDQTYYLRVARAARTDEDRSFISECLQNANWLKRSLDQRARTILKVAREIVIQQEGFFRHGVSHLRPLTLKAVAEAIGMHESTVSRVTANKAFGTSRGLFEMKYFFMAGLAGAAGCDSHSAEAVRHRIKAMIEAEPSRSPLSDDVLARTLKAQGVDIARRTVAKYRESLRIPSSAERRRAKRR
jgi:RNA polymerase sigma-54 factor